MTSRRPTAALLGLFWWKLRGLLQIAWFVMQHPRDALWSLRACKDAAGRALPEPTLERIKPQLLRPRTRSETTELASDNGAPVVIYFTGTGETPEAMLGSFQPLRAAIPALENATEYALEAPSSKGAYYGPNQFASRMWDVIAPLVSHYAGPFILIGISRGALVALDVAARIAEEQAKVASVLALSPPIVVPRSLPLPVRTVAGMEDIVAGLQDCVETGPPWLNGVVEPVVRRFQIFLTAMVLKNLGVLAERELMFAVRDIHERGAIESGLRAAREFRLLRETKHREMELLTEGFAKSVAQSPRLFASLVWGTDDTWVDVPLCSERARELRVRYPETRDRLLITEVPGQGHPLFRVNNADVEPTLRCLRQVVHEAQKQAANALPRPAHDANAPSESLREQKVSHG